LSKADHVVGAAVKDLKGERDFATARRIGETILLDLRKGDKVRGIDALIALVSATQKECKRFWDAANHGDGKSVGAHSPLLSPPVGGAMGFGEAWDFLRHLLGQWLVSK
jgi:hypothetical protein